jgi:hypothetical protein
MLYQENPQSWWRKVPPIVWVTILVIAVSALNNGVGNENRTAESNDNRSAESYGRTESNQASEGDIEPTNMTALEQMALVFEGGYSQDQIRSTLATAMSLYGLADTESNRRSAGDVLVALSNARGEPEMTILDHMIRSHVSGVTMTFSDAAAISVTALVTGDR